MAKVRSHCFNLSLLQDTTDFQQNDGSDPWFISKSDPYLCDLFFNDCFEASHAKASTPVEPRNVAKTWSGPKWNTYMDFFEKDSFSTEENKNALELSALKDKYQFDEDNPIKDKHYRPREYMRNQWESCDNPYFNEDPLFTLNRLFYGADAKETESSMNMPFQQRGKCSKADRPNDFTSDDIFASSVSTRQLNREMQNGFVNSLFDYGMQSLIRENASLNEKAFRNFSKPLSIITDEGFLNGSFKKKCDSLNAKAGDLLTIARSIMQSVPSLKEEEDEEDLPSPNKYFKPLEVLLKEDQLNERNMDSFPDGTYFNVGSDLDVLDFERSPSGSLFLESECGKKTKYFEYKYQSPTDEFMRLPRFEQPAGYQEFKVKYPVSVNDKASQTDDVEDIGESTSCRSAIDALALMSGAADTSGLEKGSASANSLFSEGFRAVAELKDWFKAEDDNCKRVSKRCECYDLLSDESWLGLDSDSDDWGEKNIWEHNGMQVCSCIARRYKPFGASYRKLLDECNDEEDQLLAQIDDCRKVSRFDISTDIENDILALNEFLHSKVRDYAWKLTPQTFPRRVPDCVINSSTHPARCSVAL